MKTLAFDMAAMCIRAGSKTPRGIDRVDMGYVGHIFSDPDTNNIGLLPTPSSMGVLRGWEVRKFASLVQAGWRETGQAVEDGLADWLWKRIYDKRSSLPGRGKVSRGRVGGALHYARLLLQARGALLRPAGAVIPQGSIYVNTGQILLGCSWFFKWLDSRPDVKPVFLMHDMIPIFYPEYCGPAESRHHVRAVKNVARRAAGMIATSQTSADEIRAALKKYGRPDIPVHVVPLPVCDAFLKRGASEQDHNEPPYFVMVGAVDQRKNHLLLLHVWRELARDPTAPFAKLVIVGPRGKRCSGIVDLAHRCPELADRIVEANGLSTPAMRELIKKARALLMPSFTEGYGLPIVEALALGTPVIASDIPAHREVGGAFGAYLDPLDGPGWRAEIMRRAAETPDQLAARRAALEQYRPQTWASYFDEVVPFLNSL
jgi:glycosyltransferase involved in cell wall biosynthesis